MEDDLLIEAVCRQLNGKEWSTYEDIRNDLIHLASGRDQTNYLPPADIRHVCHLNELPLNDVTINAVLSACSLSPDKNRVNFLNFCSFLSRADWKGVNLDYSDIDMPLNNRSNSMLQSSQQQKHLQQHPQPPRKGRLSRQEVEKATMNGSAPVELSRYDIATLLEIISELRDENANLKKQLQCFEDENSSMKQQKQQQQNQQSRRQWEAPTTLPVALGQFERDVSPVVPPINKTSYDASRKERIGARVAPFATDDALTPLARTTRTKPFPVSNESPRYNRTAPVMLPSHRRMSLSQNPALHENSNIFGNESKPALPKLFTSPTKHNMDMAEVERVAKRAREQLHMYNYTDHKSLQEAFLNVDENQTGRIDKCELRNLCRSVKLPIDDRTLSALMNACDPDGNAMIDFVKFSNHLNPVCILRRDTAVEFAAAPLDNRNAGGRFRNRQQANREPPWAVY